MVKMRGCVLYRDSYFCIKSVYVLECANTVLNSLKLTSLLVLEIFFYSVLQDEFVSLNTVTGTKSRNEQLTIS